MTYFRNKRNNFANQQTTSVAGRNPDRLLTVPGTEIELSIWTASAGSQNAGQTSVGFDRVTYGSDGTKRRNRTFRFSRSEDLVGLLLGVIGALELAAQDETLPGNLRSCYLRLAEEAGAAVAVAMDPAKPQAKMKPEMSLTALAAQPANGRVGINSKVSSLLS
ncbi:hypothetical protein [Botrimarina mediterranea]|uniref:Uncharacterized protein n=1 Tax=Botrimarina mediterranea TaxID=2528022 RepID=A0A518K611_9BACT|nr:hypothetical protein [Botrimarina mediterranea]QDV73232.1 hypothetical protein Spa11_14280 [Botrimarina mediterranea]